jgi:hypothetical protein
MNAPVKMRHCFRGGVDDVIIFFTEQHLGVKFPELFLDCIRECDSGAPHHACFEFFSKSAERVRNSFIGAFISFLPTSKNNILKDFFKFYEFSSKGLLAFADVGNGDLICFDYSVSGWEDPDPPIVYWDYYAENPEKAVSDIAINFEAFLKMLKPCADEEENSDSSEA